MQFKKGEKNLAVLIIKLAIFLFVIGVQSLVFYVIYKGSQVFSNTFSVASKVLQFIAVIYILYGHEKLAYKIPWLIFIMFMPIAGIIIYLLWGTKRVGKKMKAARDKAISNSHYLLREDANELTEIEEQDKDLLKQIKLIKNLTEYPLYKNEDIKYFNLGEEYFESLIKDIENAKKYILIEYYIIAKGELFNRISKVLKQKLKDGINVYIIADEMGSLLRYPRHEMNELMELGAKIKRFNPLRFGINTYINYRDHRKIVVIDGIIAYTGGVNIADEYINEQIRFGHWKDNGIRVYGIAVESFIVAFLKNYEFATNKVPDYKWFFENRLKIEDNISNQGYTMFYTDGPDNRRNPAENVYIDFINSAKDYMYIYTPYLVPGPELLTSLLSAAHSGVDVRIVTPHKPDKWYVHLISRSYYDVLIEAGVRIYEYLPGFMHAKTFLSDDTKAIVGSINLDYRSLNLNYECATLMYKTGTEKNIKKDFLDTLEKCQEIKLEDVRRKNVIVKMLEAIMNTFAPLF